MLRAALHCHGLGKIGAERTESAVGKNCAVTVYAEDADVLASDAVYPQQNVSTCQVLKDAACSLRATSYAKNAGAEAGAAFRMAKHTRIETAGSKGYTLHPAAA